MSAPAGSRTRATAILLIAIANIIGGVSYPAQKEALAGLPPATVTLLRNLVALACLAWFARSRRIDWSAWTRADVRRSALLGILAFAAPMLLGIEGVRRASAANASILILLEPTTIVAIAWLVMGERIGAAKLVGLVAGLGGALVIVLEGASFADLVSGEHVVGNTMLAVHGCLWGLYTPLAKPLTERHDPVAICLVATAFSMLLFVPAALVEAPQWKTGPELAPALAWCAGLGLVVSFLATVLWLTALKHLSGTSVAAFVFLQPLAGVLTAVLFQDERLTKAGLVGGGLIAFGVALDLFRKPGPRIQAPLP